MSLIGNLLWLVLGGFVAALGYFLAGLVLCVTIVGIPFGVQCFKLGVAILAPFGKEVREFPGTNSPLRVVFNVLWIIFAGWEIAMFHAAMALACAVTIIGIPFAIQHLKLVPLALVPFGREFD